MTKHEQAVAERKKRIVSLIRDIGKTSHELMRHIGMSRVTMDRDLEELHECGEVHVEEWRQIKGIFAAVYRAGFAADAEMPPQLAERLRAYRETIDARAEERRSFKAFRHWMDVALFGEYRRPA